MVAVAQKLVEQHPDGEQIRGDVPAIQAGVGCLIGRRAGMSTHGVADPGGDVEVKQFGSGAGEDHVERFDVAVDQSFVPQVRPLAGLGFGQVTVAALVIELLEARRVGMKSDERVEQVQGNIDCLPVAEVLVPGGEVME